MSLLAKVTKLAPKLPSRVVLYAGEKFGKSSFGAHAPAPIVLMTQGETGLLSLLDAGRVPPVDHFPEDFQTWGTLVQAVRELRDQDHRYKTLVLDTGNGAEQLCAADVCQEKFRGNWAEYLAFGRGNEQATKPWAEFLKLLDEVRVQRRMSVLLLQHARVKSFKNPIGEDWDQWRPEAIDKLWALTHKWSDVILFGGFKVQVDRDGKAAGERRYLRTEASAAIVAGNRYGLPPEIVAPSGADKLWAAFAAALARAKGQAAAPRPATDQRPPQDQQPVQEPARDRQPGEDDAEPEAAPAPQEQPA